MKERALGDAIILEEIERELEGHVVVQQGGSASQALGERRDGFRRRVAKVFAAKVHTTTQEVCRGSHAGVSPDFRQRIIDVSSLVLITQASIEDPRGHNQIERLIGPKGTEVSDFEAG